MLKESDDVVILGVKFNSKMTFEKHLRSVSRASSQMLVILRSTGKYSMIDCSFEMLLGFCRFRFEVLFSVVLGCRYTP